MKDQILSAGRVLLLPFSGVVLCHALVLGYGEALARHAVEPPGPGATLVLLGLGFFVLLLPLSLSLSALYRSLKRQPRSQAFALVLGGYITVLLAFASLYYLFAIIGDFVDTRESNAYYSTEVRAMRQRSNPELRYRQLSRRAFSGVSARLWSGVEQRYGPLEDPRSGPPGVDTILAQTSSPNLPLDYQPQNRLAVWLDCFHFSTVTITTLGYGDIIPIQWYSKLAADLEVLIGLVFVSLSIGRLLSDRESDA